jgi:hypothetical protein
MLIVLPTLLLQEFYHILSIRQKGIALSVIKTQGVLTPKFQRFFTKMRIFPLHMFKFELNGIVRKGSSEKANIQS